MSFCYPFYIVFNTFAQVLRITTHKKTQTMVRQCFILFGCMALGELIIMVTGMKLPSSIIGMLLLTLLLKLKVIKVEWVRGLTDFLIANLGFFFVPPGVALMLHFNLIKAEIVPIIGATVVSTALVLLVTGHTHQIVAKGEKKITTKIKDKIEDKRKNHDN